MGQPLAFTLPASYLTGAGSYVRIRPTWLSGYATSTTAPNVYLGVKVARAGDADMNAVFDRRVGTRNAQGNRVRSQRSTETRGRRLGEGTGVSPAPKIVLCCIAAGSRLPARKKYARWAKLWS